jgi:SAM-dependent methyltransferase
VERAQYGVMYRREDRHWWYAGMRQSALALLEQALAGRGPVRLLDAGCGTGGTTAALRRFGTVVGVDLAEEALAFAARRGLGGALVRASVERLPFADRSFDAVTSFEVVYHLGVADDERALAECRRVLKPDGVLLLRVPAHDWLRGEHDRLVHTRHRYGRAEVAAKLQAAGFRVDHLSWANALLFPAAATKRLLEQIQPHTNGVADGEPDLWLPPAPLNTGLRLAVGAEALALPRRIPLPFGLSLIALAHPA